MKGSAPRITLTDTAGSDDVAKIFSSSGALYFQQRDGSSHGEMIFRTEDNSSAVERMRLDSSGRLLIGTTAHWGSDVKLHLANSGNTFLVLTSGTSNNSVLAFSDDGSERGSIDYDHNGDHMLFKTAASERMRITGDGPHLLLGGTADVNEITESSSNAGMVIGGTGFGNAGLAIITSTSGSGRLYFGDATGNASGRNSGGIIYSHSDNALSFRTNDSTAFKAHNGQFEVGTTAGDNGTFAFFNNSTSGNEAGTAGQDGAADKCFHIRADMGPTHLDKLGTDNFTLKLTNQAYSGSGISNPQGTVTKILFNGVTYNGWNGYGVIGLDMQNASGGRGDLFFATGSPTERMRIDSSGRFFFGNHAQGAHGGHFNIDCSGSSNNGLNVKGTTANYVMISSAGGSTGDHIFFSNYTTSNTNTGRIKDDGSNVTYHTTSDYRLKENVVAISDGISRVKQLNPIRHTWIGNSAPGTIDGWLAHELDEVCPYAVDGEKDATNPDGSIYPQSVDYGRITPLLTAALKEAIAKIETLETQVRALQSS